MILRLPSKFLAPDKVHDLRVEIKRIEAFFHLLKWSSSRFAKAKYFKPFKLLFRNAGKLRSVQIDFDLINRHFINDNDVNYLHHLHESKIKRHKELHKLIKKGIRKDLRKDKKEIIRLVKKVSIHTLQSYFKKQEDYLSSLLQKNIFREERLHFIRKKLKRYYLNAKSMKAFNISHHWDTLLEQLGEWHDHQVMVYQLMKAIQSGQLNSTEIKHLKQLKLTIQLKKNELFEHIILTYFETQAKREYAGQPSELVIHPS
jgi:hypothetical protein